MLLSPLRGSDMDPGSIIIQVLKERNSNMGTLTQEIFSYKLGRTVEEGETVVVDVDHVMSHDTTTPLAIQAFRKLTHMNGGRVFNAHRSHIVFDHIIPAATIAAATFSNSTRPRRLGP